jgi:hypothetical protein
MTYEISNKELYSLGISYKKIIINTMYKVNKEILH